MKLYIYDHCPFCVRARMMLGLRRLHAELVFLANDDETTPVKLIGEKQVPILQKDDGSYMPESLDIVRYLDELAGSKKLDEHIRPEIQAWYDHVNTYANRLLFPRNVRLGLPEFSTPSATTYFILKKEAATQTAFAQMLADTSSCLARIHADLNDLAALVGIPHALNGKAPSMEDIIIFPVLRNLSMVKGICFPEPVSAYLHDMAAQSGVDLYFDRAL